MKFDIFSVITDKYRLIPGDKENGKSNKILSLTHVSFLKKKDVSLFYIFRFKWRKTLTLISNLTNGHNRVSQKKNYAQ